MARLVLRGGRGPVAPPPAAVVVGAHVRRALAQCGLDVGVHAAQGRGPGGNCRLLAESLAEGRWSCRLSAQLSGRLLVQVGCIKDTLSLKQGGNTQLYPKFYAVDECLPHAFRGDRAVADCCCRNFRLNIRIAGARMNRRSLPAASMASSSPSAHPTTPSILSHTLGKMPRPWTQVLATRRRLTLKIALDVTLSEP